MSEELTLAKMITVAPNQPINLPPEFAQTLGKQNAILIISKTTSEARIIPTDSPEAIKITITINKLSQKFLKDLGTVIVKNKVNFLYTTGLCRKGKLCYYEGYIDKTQIKTNLETLKNEIQQLEGVTTVEITTIKHT
ncbi:MAG: hypothetical protein QW225_05400 [Candidatus Jordarchaeales archaeon]